MLIKTTNSAIHKAKGYSTGSLNSVQRPFSFPAPMNSRPMDIFSFHGNCTRRSWEAVKAGSFMNGVIAGSLESANSSILAARRHFKEVVGK